MVRRQEEKGEDEELPHFVFLSAANDSAITIFPNTEGLFLFLPSHKCNANS